jgi:hypothetical protein
MGKSADRKILNALRTLKNSVVDATIRAGKRKQAGKEAGLF